MKILPVILSGGSGTRLWPLSRSGHPKQLKALSGAETMIQQTAERLPCDRTILPPIVICNENHRFLIAEQLREIGVKPSRIVLEPVARSTGPAIAVAALLANVPEETVLAVMPADHFIEDKNAFLAAIRQASALAMRGPLMTLGIKPTKPHTGFGYIEMGEALTTEPVPAYTVSRFKEKPDLATAETYVASGKYLWNAGIFVLRADRYLAEVDRLQPEMGAACREAVKNGKEDLDFLRLDQAAFEKAPNLSIDYAILEHSNAIGVLPVAFDWNDVGGWQALWELGEKDPGGNVVEGDTILRGVKNSYVRGENRLITAIGLENIVLVDTADALLVADMKRVDEVKEIVSYLKKEQRAEERLHEKVWRPWGYYERIDSGDRFMVKRLMVRPGASMKLQVHHHRAEHWVVVCGTARVICDDTVSVLGPNESVYIPLGSKHRVENPGKVPLHLIEVQSGDYLGDDDILRFDGEKTDPEERN